MKYLLILFLSLNFLNANSQSRKDSIIGSRIEFSERIFDFGDIEQGDSVSHVFEYTNTGNEPLKIVRAISTCSCTPVIEDTTSTIMPGEKGKIVVGFKSADKQGILQRQVTVFSNATNPVEKVTIRINILPKLKKTSKSR